jgi:hypothetical protein
MKNGPISKPAIDKRRLFLFFNAILSWNNGMVSDLINTIIHPIGF